MINIFIADVKKLDIVGSLDLVSPRRREKIMRFANIADQRQSLGVELLLKKATGRTDYALTENGKPFFSDGRVFFSLAHCGNYAVCAVSETDIGVDIELERNNSARLAQRFFSSEEAEMVANSHSPDEEFCRLWTLKESYIKAADLHLSDMSSFSVAHGVDGYCFENLKFGEYTISCCAKTQDIGEINIHNEKI